MLLQCLYLSVYVFVDISRGMEEPFIRLFKLAYIENLNKQVETTGETIHDGEKL